MGELQRITRESVAEVGPVRPSSASTNLSRRSGPPVSAATGSRLMVMMAQMQAAYPHQTLPPETPDMWLARWEDLTIRYGIGHLAEAIRLTMREPGRRFMPLPDEIAETCERMAGETRREQDKRQYLTKLDDWKTTYERERAEDAARAKGEAA